MAEKFTAKLPDGAWTPRRALLWALQECEDWSDVVIMGLAIDGNTRGIQATSNHVIRQGLFAEGLSGDWHD